MIGTSRLSGAIVRIVWGDALRGTNFCAIALILFSLLLLPLRPAVADVITVAPDAVTVETGSSSTVIVSYDGSGSIPQLRLLPSPGVGYQVLQSPKEGDTVPPFKWLVRISLKTAISTDTNVIVQLERGRAVVATGQIKVTPKAAPDVASSVQAELLLDGEVLLDGRTSIAFLKLTNLTDYDLRVAPPTFFKPDELKIRSNLKAPATLAARGIRMVRLELNPKAGATVTSGKHIIGLVIPVSRISTINPWHGELAVSKEITAGVPGMTELQIVLQIPSLLLLPGLLVVVSFFAIFKFGAPGLSAGTDLTERLSFVWSPWLWISAITISGAVIFLYPYLTGLVNGVQRDILYGYSMRDLVAVWVGSIGLGAAGGGLLRGAVSLKAWRDSRYQFQAGEPPLEFLKRLARMKKGHKFAFVQKDQQLLYRLGSVICKETEWAAPTIYYEPADSKFDARQITDALRSEEVQSLIDCLSRHVEKREIVLSWGSYGAINNPQIVPTAEFQSSDANLKKSIVDRGI